MEARKRYAYTIKEFSKRGEKMREVNINLPNNLMNGTLLWIDASSNKVFHSSKRFDVVEFTEHDSNYLGELKDVFSSNKQHLDSIMKVLEGSERIFGIYLKDADEQEKVNKDTINAEALFFSTWEKLQDFAEDYFEKYDQIESKRMEESKRRKLAKDEWLERGRRFLKK